MVKNEYDIIPDILGKELLELGGRDGKRQLSSNKRDSFLSANSWTNIDKNFYSNEAFLFIHQDINSLSFVEWNEKFDTVLMLDVIEHLDIRTWKQLFAKIKRSLKNGGHVILTCPYNENLENVLDVYPDNELDHTVFRITEKTINRFLPGAKFQIFSKWAYREKHEGFLLPLLRFFKRLVVGNYFVNGLLPRRKKLLVVWQKR